MERAGEIKQALDRVEAIIKAKPAAGQATKTGRATLKGGLLCEYTEDGKTVQADMPQPFGGEGKVLSPGGYARAGLATCLAIGYAMRAARLGITLQKVEVDLETDADIACMFGFPVEPYGDFRYNVRIESDAPEVAVKTLIDEADARSPVLHVFREAMRVVRTIEVSPAEAVNAAQG